MRSPVVDKERESRLFSLHRGGVMGTSVVHISCCCGKEHLLRPGFDAPVYWCHDTLSILLVGDEVIIEEE